MKRFFQLSFSVLFLAAVLGGAVSCCHKTDKQMIRINVMIQTTPENRAQLLDNLLELAEKSRAEQGCIDYEILENSRDSLRFMILETWENQEVLSAHQQSEHFTRIIPLNKELIANQTSNYFNF